MKAQELVNALRQLKAHEGTERRLRATFLAKAFAYKTSFNPAGSFDEIFASNEDVFRKALQDVNEILLVDTRLAMDIYKSLLKARYEVATNECDETLMNYVLGSTTQKDLLNEDTAKSLSLLCGDSGYHNLCKQVSSMLSTGED